MEDAWEGHDDGADVQRITAADLRDVLRRAFEDFGAYRTDVVSSACSILSSASCWPASVWGYGMVPLLFHGVGLRADRAVLSP